MTTETAVMHASGIAMEPAVEISDVEHHDSGPHEGENGTLSPSPEAPPLANGDAMSGHSFVGSSAPEPDPQDAGASKADDKGEAAGGHPFPEPWKKR